MADLARGGVEPDTPVNPYSLLEAVNNASDTAHTGWLIFLAVMTYLMIAVAGVTHEALLLDTPVQLPILQVNIQLKQFFQFAPIVLVLFHLGLVAQLVLLARETLEFDHAIRMLETSEKRNHPLRLELHNFFFVQGIAGPQRSAVMSLFLHIMTWLTIVILPVILLLYMQVSFLPYHDVTTTWINRVALSVDVAMLLLIGVFLFRVETSFFQAFWRSTATHPVSAVTTGLVLAGVVYISYFAATVPGEPLDRMSRSLHAWTKGLETDRVHQSGFALPFLPQRADGTLFGIFLRNIVVTDSDLSSGQKRSGEKTLNLRGRDMRFAKLDRADLEGADLTGALLDGASLVGANLRNAWLNCVQIDQLLLRDDRDGARCASARGADLTRADLTGAHLSGIDLRSASAEEARLDGADLSNAILSGANFSSARLERAEITGGVQAQGANFLNAAMQGADLTGAQLQFADLSSAGLQGASLNFAQMQAAVVRDADLDASSLQNVKLHGADLSGSKIAGADLRGAVIWMTSPPQWDTNGLADLSELSLRPIDEAEQGALKAAAERLPDAAARARAREAMTPLAASVKKWPGTAEQLRWQSWVGASPPPPAANYRSDLTGYLAKMMCSARWTDGSIATGVARRAVARQFRGDPTAVYDKLQGSSCTAGKSVGDDLMRELSVAAEQARVPAPVPAQQMVPGGLPGAVSSAVPGGWPPAGTGGVPPGTTSSTLPAPPTLPGPVSSESAPLLAPPGQVSR
jgi:uncharacterized protein YjbI with pentapeptide repeats